MEVKEKNARIWRKDIEGRNGTFHKYSVSVSKKNEDGTRVNAYIPVRFSKKANAPDVVPNGAPCDFEGFMSVDAYKDKEGKTIATPMIIIMSAEFQGDIGGGEQPRAERSVETDSFQQADDDIPFN